MLLTTTDSLGDGYEIVEVLGLVSAGATEGVSVFSEFWAKIRNVIGGHVPSIDACLDQAASRAWDKLVEEAEGIGADAVVGLDMEVVVLPYRKGLMVHHCLAGTAVKTRRK